MMEAIDDTYATAPRKRATGTSNQGAVVDRLNAGGPLTMADDTPTYTPPNGNTGVSGYGGSNNLPPLASAGPAPPAYSGGDARAWIQSLLGNGRTDERTLRDLAPVINNAFGPDAVQIASDGTARGRLHNIPGYGMVTLIGDQQTWGDGGWAWRTGNEQYGSGGSSPTLPWFSPPGATETPTSTPGNNPSGGVNTAFIDALMKLLNPTQASLTDPDLAAQSQANRVGQQRSYERRRASAAERAASSGTMGGALDGQIDTLLSARGDAESTYDADLLAGKNDQNRESQLAALGPALGLLGLDQNDEHFDLSIALQKALAEAGLNQSSLLALLGGI